MNAAEPEKPDLVECGVAGRMLEGQSVSGDRHVIRPFKDGVLLAVIDGVGHGDEAAAAAKAAADILEIHASGQVISLVKLCHQALAQTRGAVMTLASLNKLYPTLTWLRRGNV